MTEETNTLAADRKISFRGRDLAVQMPRPEQLLVWQRTVRRLQGEDVAGWDAAQVMNALERARSIIDSVLSQEADRDWLDDEMLTNGLTFQDAAELITRTVEAFADENNRADRRARTPAKKAARKAPSKRSPR